MLAWRPTRAPLRQVQVQVQVQVQMQVQVQVSMQPLPVLQRPLAWPVQRLRWVLALLLLLLRPAQLPLLAQPALRPPQRHSAGLAPQAAARDRCGSCPAGISPSPSPQAAPPPPCQTACGPVAV